MNGYKRLSERQFSVNGTLVTEAIPYQVFGDCNNTMHFLHANGYSPLVYQGLFKRLTQSFRVKAPLLRPLWESPSVPNLNDWWPFVADTDAYFDAQGPGPHLAVGHSIGATLLLLSAIKNPDQYSGLVLVDPAVFSRRVYWTYRLLSLVNAQRLFQPLIQKTLKRRTTFSSAEELFDRFRSKPIFKRFSDLALIDYIQGSFLKGDSGFELLYPTDWEAHIYETGILIDAYIWSNINRIHCPITLIRGEFSNVCSPSVEARFAASNPNLDTVTIANSGHLVPLEQADAVADIISSFVSDHDL